MSAFSTAMEQESVTRTWNGAVSKSTPDETGVYAGRLKLFFKAVRGINTKTLWKFLDESARESIVDTVVLCFYIRDCRGGKAERDLGRECFRWLLARYPVLFSHVMEYIPEYGRWDDILYLFPKVFDISSLNIKKSKSDLATKYQEELPRLVGNQLLEDLMKMNGGENVSVCAKWTLTEGDSLDKKYGVLEVLLKSMGWTPRKYRKDIVSPLRSYTQIVEKLMCTNKWENINFSRVPSCAMRKLKKSFEKHQPTRFKKWKSDLEEGKVEVKAKQLQPHELVYDVRNGKYDSVTEAQWKVLEEKVKSCGSLEKTLPIVDVSGSMTMIYDKKKSGVAPIDVAIGLGLITASCGKGPWKNMVISFHEIPTLIVLRKSGLLARYREISGIPWGGSTDIMKVFSMILDVARKHGLSQDDLPDTVMIFSDMQFNQAGGNNTNYEKIDKMYHDSDYERPNIVFWNVNGASDDYPISTDENGTALISGFSPEIMRNLLDGDTLSPTNVFNSAVTDERYRVVRDVIEDRQADKKHLA